MASLFKSISNWFRSKKDKAAKSLSDPIRDGKYAIEDSEQKIREFQTKVAKFMAVNKQLEREIDAQRREIDKWLNIARKAAAAGNQSDVAQAVEAKQRAEGVLEEKQKQFDKNEAILANLRRQVQIAIAKVAKARSNHAQLVARHQGAQVRKELAQAATEFGGGAGPLSELDDLQKAVDAEEAEAEAFEEMATTTAGSSALEEKYSAGSTATVNDEVARLMAEANRESSLRN